MAASTQASVPPPVSGYFMDSKKGEVNELKELLKNLNVERDMKRKREIIKKVIANMTLGIDVSRLFTDMMMAIETKDMVVKKMIYFYMCTYAAKEPDLAIMCINTLRRDCDNEDPMVRGLALRSICSLKLESMLEYMEQPLKKCLTDVSPYVRKTAVLGILKVFHISEQTVEEGDYISILYGMLQDVDSTVVTNAVLALDEILINKGGIELSTDIMMRLLNRIGEFNEWGLNTVLDLLTRYQPAGEEEIYAIMNLLDPVLRTTNSGAVLQTIKCFLHVTKFMPELHGQIYQRTKPPLLTFIAGSQPEIQYVVLNHLKVILLTERARGIYDDEYRQLFVRHNEPPHIKHMKVDLFAFLANDKNARDMVTELSEYATDIDAELAKRSIVSLCDIAMRVPSMSGDIAQKLIGFVGSDVPYIRTESVVCLGNLLRMYSELVAMVTSALPDWLVPESDNTTTSVITWMLGEYGENIPEAPYMLEPLIDDYSNTEVDSSVKLQLLTAAMKLFYKRPPEMQAMLGRLLEAALNDFFNQDVHDKALFYYRLLSSGETTASYSLFAGLGDCVGKKFFEYRETENMQQVYEEFNSLAIIYGVPSAQFIDPSFLRLNNFVMADPRTASDLLAGDVGAADLMESATPQPAPAAAAPLSGNLLDFMDPAPTTAPAAAPAPKTIRLKALPATPTVTPSVFQQWWGSYPDIYNGKLCNLPQFPTSLTVSELESLFREQQILTIASGMIPPDNLGMKFFLFGEESVCDLMGNEEGGVKYVVQLCIASTSGPYPGEVQVVVKASDANANLDHIMIVLMQSLTSLGACH